MSVLQQLWIISALLFSKYFKHTLLHFFEHEYLQSQQNFILNLDHFSTAAMLETSPQPCTAHSAITSNTCQQTLTNDRTSTTTNKFTPNKSNQISKPLKPRAQTNHTNTLNYSNSNKQHESTAYQYDIWQAKVLPSQTHYQ